MIYDSLESGRCYDGSFQNEKALDLYVGFPRAEGASSTITLWTITYGCWKDVKIISWRHLVTKSQKIKFPISWILDKAEVTKWPEIQFPHLSVIK